MEEGKAGGKTTLEIACTHEVEKEVERDDGLVHDHLKEMEGVCKDKVERWGGQRCWPPRHRRSGRRIGRCSGDTHN